MCSIIGYYGKNLAAPILVKGLEKMEYRGYDSVGVATKSENEILVKKGVGKVIEVNNAIHLDDLPGITGIGHTRWATHGGVTDSNAHPHSSNDGKISIVHNGIIENASQLLQRVRKLGYEVKSETDSELVVHLFDHELKTQSEEKSPLDAFNSTVRLLKGSWALAVIMSGSDSILIARNGAPGNQY